MSKYQGFKDAIQAYEPDAADTPFLLSSTELNGKAFNALLGRKFNSKGMLVTTVVFGIAVLVGAFIGGWLSGGPGTAPFGVMVVMVAILFIVRTTLITVNDEGLELYFIDSKLSGKSHTVYEKVSLPYDKITEVKTRKGRFNTAFRFHFSHDGKNYKIRITVPNKKKHIPEQEANMSRFLEVIDNIVRNS